MPAPFSAATEREPYGSPGGQGIVMATVYRTGDVPPTSGSYERVDGDGFVCLKPK